MPVVKLGVGDYWIPNAHGGAALRIGKFDLLKAGSLLRGYFWFHIIAGWVLTTLWVGGFTGLIKSESDFAIARRGLYFFGPSVFFQQSRPAKS